MFATRTLTAAALILTASVASAQLPAPKPVNPPKVNPNLQLPPRPNLGLNSTVTEQFNRPDLAVTGLRVVAGDKVEVTVANVGRSATTVAVQLRVGSSGTGNLDNPSAQERVTVPDLAVSQHHVFTTADDKLVRRARVDRTTSQGVIFLAANVDANEQVTELKEANNVMIITTK